MDVKLLLFAYHIHGVHHDLIAQVRVQRLGDSELGGRGDHLVVASEHQVADGAAELWQHHSLAGCSEEDLFDSLAYVLIRIGGREPAFRRQSKWEAHISFAQTHGRLVFIEPSISGRGSTKLWWTTGHAFPNRSQDAESLPRS